MPLCSAEGFCLALTLLHSHPFSPSPPPSLSLYHPTDLPSASHIVHMFLLLQKFGLPLQESPRLTLKRLMGNMSVMSGNNDVLVFICNSKHG